MSFTPIAPGTINWDVPLNAALTNIDSEATTAQGAATTAQATANTALSNANSALAQIAGEVGPSNHGAIAWSFDPTAILAGQTGTAGTLYLASMYVDTTITATKLFWGQTTAGITPTAGENFIGLYSATGTRLANVNVDAKVTIANTMQTETISVALTPGMYWVAFLFNAATMPSVWRGNFISTQVVNFNLTTSTQRFATNGTGLVALPSTITTSSNVPSMDTYWAALA